MSKLKYSLRRSFSAYILLMYYQSSDPWVDSNQWLISQRPQEWSLVDTGKLENFLTDALVRQWKETKYKTSKVCCSKVETLGFSWACAVWICSYGCAHVWKPKTGFRVYLDHSPYYCFYLILHIIIVCVCVCIWIHSLMCRSEGEDITSGYQFSLSTLGSGAPTQVIQLFVGCLRLCLLIEPCGRRWCNCKDT